MQVRPGLSAAIPRISLNLIGLVALELLLSPVSLANASSQVRYLRQDYSGQQAIRVWKVGSPHRGDLPDIRIPLELKERAAKLDCRLDVRAMPARDFSTSFVIALKTNDEPDILVIDNMGLIFGFTTPLGHFDGIGRYPKVPATFITVSESLRSFQAQSGWEFLIRTSRNFENAKALAMSGASCRRDYSENSVPWTGELVSDISRMAVTATSAYFNNDVTALDSMVGGRYSDDSLPLTSTQNQISGIATCGGWGNVRLAFVYTATAFESNDRLGFRSLLVVAAKVDGRWQLLLLGEDPTIVKTLQTHASPLTTNVDIESKLRAPTLVAPADNAYFRRWPMEERPEVEWTRASGKRITYLLESQFKGRGLWFGRRLDLVTGAREDALTIKFKATFGIGKQPHRWRIWAINDDGEVVRSEWRTVNYLD